MKKITSLLLAAVMMILCAAPALALVGLANPWRETTEDELIQTLGFRFTVPTGAAGVVYRMMESQSLAEMHFSLGGTDYVARIQPAAEFTDISGLYYDPWTLSDDCTVLGREGRLMLTADGSRFIGLCLWYDAAPGLMYSLSANSGCLGGLDLIYSAEEMFTPVQGEADAALSADELREALIACTGYEGTAGSSLKNAAAALGLLSLSMDERLAKADFSALRATVSEALDGLDPDLTAELAGNLSSMHSLLLSALAGSESAMGLFESAGIQDAARTLLDEPDAYLHWSALFGLLTGALC